MSHLIALVAAVENESTSETYIGTQVMELHTRDDPELVREWIYEFVKTKNPDMRIKVLEILPDMEYTIYAYKIKDYYYTFFAFTTGKYLKINAQKCLEEFERKFLDANKSNDLSEVSSDDFETIKGLDSLLTRYYDGAVDVNEIIDRANAIKNRANKNLQDTKDLDQMTKRIKDNTESMNKKSRGISKSNSCCRVF